VKLKLPRQVRDLPHIGRQSRKAFQGLVKILLLHSLKVMVTLRAIVSFAAQAAVLETGDRNRKDTGRCVRAFRSILCRREPYGGLV
jgi:hypothetical protein